MAAGQSNKPKIGYIIQARMQSSRLPGKVLLPIPISADKPMIWWITDQLNTGSLHQNIVVATSKNPADDQLDEYCKNRNIYVFRGDEEDVLSRFISITEEYGFDVVVRLTGDNPLLDIEIFEKSLHHHIKYGVDYSATKQLPVGMNVEIISGEALKSLKSKKLSADDKEHVTHYIKHSDEYSKNWIQFDVNPDLKNLRLTVDYPSDYAVLSFILSHYKKELTGLNLLEYVFENYPWIFQVNKQNVQKKQFKDENDEIKHAIEMLEQADMKQAAGILRRYNA